jgi:hypothetical protein
MPSSFLSGLFYGCPARKYRGACLHSVSLGDFLHWNRSYNSMQHCFCLLVIAGKRRWRVVLRLMSFASRPHGPCCYPELIMFHYMNDFAFMGHIGGRYHVTSCLAAAMIVIAEAA